MTTVSMEGKKWEEMMGEDIKVMRLKEGDGPLADMKSTIFCGLMISVYSPETNSAELIEVCHNERYIIGESDCIPALELPLRHSRPGDHLLIRCHHKFGYGTHGRPQLKGKDGVITPAIPPNSGLQLEVYVKAHFDEEHEQDAADSAMELCSTTPESSYFNSPDSHQQFRYTPSATGGGLTIPAIREKIIFRKEAGNRWFSYKDYARASRAYTNGIKTAENYCSQVVPKSEEQQHEEHVKAELTAHQSGGSEYDPELTEQERLHRINKAAAEKTAAAMKEQAGRNIHLDPGIMTEYVNCLNNLATCSIQLGEWNKAGELCLRVLELDKNNIKGLLRAAKVSLHQSNYDDAQLCLDTVKKLDPDRPELAVELARLKKAKGAYKRRDREMSQRMTSKLFPQQTEAVQEQDVRQQTSSETKTDMLSDPPHGENMCVHEDSCEKMNELDVNEATESFVMADTEVNKDRKQDLQQDQKQKQEHVPVEREVSNVSAPVEPVPAVEKPSDSNSMTVLMAIMALLVAIAGVYYMNSQQLL